MAKKEMKNKWYSAIKIILILVILSFLVSWLFPFFIGVEFKEGNVALIPVKGVITSESVRIFGQEVASSSDIVGFIEEADKNPKIKAIRDQ